MRKEDWTLETCLEALKRIRLHGVAKFTLCLKCGVSFENSNEMFCTQTDSEVPFSECGMAITHEIITRDDMGQLVLIGYELLTQAVKKEVAELTALKQDYDRMRKEVQNGK